VVLAARQLADCGRSYGVLINGTAGSLAGVAELVPAAALADGALALDMMYGPAARPFLAWSAAHGARGRDGLGMLVEQAAEAFELWRGVRPLTADVLAELRASVDAA
jgi:shikimate dehydrogenase